MPESQLNPDVQWRMEEYVRVLNASVVVDAATGKRFSSREFAYVPFEKFALDKPGKKFTRITRSTENQTFVHCFVENETGKVIKAAGWKAPAKDKDGLAYRYDLMDEESRHDLYSQGTRATFYVR